MWVKKSTTERVVERKYRIKIAKYFLVFCIGLYLYWFNAEVGTIDNFIELYYLNPEYSSLFVLTPILIYTGYNGWGFMPFGYSKKKWYQIKACETPGKCNILGKHQVRWVSDNGE